jgi:hypothetical protein
VVDSGFAGCSVVITAPSSECVQDFAYPHPSLRNNTLSPDASARPLRPKSDRSLIIMQSVAMCQKAPSGRDAPPQPFGTGPHTPGPSRVDVHGMCRAGWRRKYILAEVHHGRQ